MIGDVPPKLVLPPAIMMPARPDAMDIALARAGASRTFRRAVDREVSRAGHFSPYELIARADAEGASVPMLLALAAARRRAAPEAEDRYAVRYSGPAAGSSGSIILADVPLGPVSSERLISVAIGWINDAGGGAQLAGVSIGGTSLARVTRAASSSVAANAEVWDGLVATGESGDLVLAFSVSQNFTAHIAVISLVDVSPGTPAQTDVNPATSVPIALDLGGAGARIVASYGNGSGAALSGGITQLSRADGIPFSGSFAVGAKQLPAADEENVLCTLSGSGRVRIAGHGYLFN